MKRIAIFVTACSASLALLAGCNDTVERTFYDGPEYIMFADTLNNRYVMPEGVISVDVSATQTCDYDRTFGVEIVAKGSNALENRHFNLVSENVVIKAGERAAKVEIQPYYDNFEITDSLGTVLRLVTPKNTQWEMYGAQTKVVFEKYVPFDSDRWFENEKRASDPEKYNYVNYMLYATFPYSTTADQMIALLVKVERDAKDKSRFVIKMPFQAECDLPIQFVEMGAGEDYLKVLPRETLYTSDYGWVTMASAQQSPSYFNTGKREIKIYLNCYVEGLGSFGVYPYIMRWISEHDAEEIRNNGM